MELLRGVRTKRELNSVKTALANLDFQILALTENVGHRASIYLEEYGMKTNLGVPDALSAATAGENGATLCSANAKDYRAITELNLKVFHP